MSSRSILVTGSMSYDIIMNFPSRFQEHLLPEKLHQLNVSFVVNSLEKQFGGTGLNIAYGLGLMKYPSVKLLSSVGKDGHPIIDFIKARGIDVSTVIQDKKLYSATGQVITDLDNNQIWGFYYGACELAKDISIQEHVSPDCILVISANHPEAFIGFQKQAIEQKVDYLYDPGMTLTWNKPEDLKAGVLHAKWLVGNDYEISRILEKIDMTLDQLIDAGIIVITTLGDQGVRYKDSNQELFAPAFQPKKISDPTGAGDAWRAGFLEAIVTGKTLDIALSQGNALASFAVECYGTANHSPSGEEISTRVQWILDHMD